MAIEQHIQIDRIEMATRRIREAADIPRLDRAAHPLHVRLALTG